MHIYIIVICILFVDIFFSFIVAASYLKAKTQMELGYIPIGTAGGHIRVIRFNFKMIKNDCNLFVWCCMKCVCTIRVCNWKER